MSITYLEYHAHWHLVDYLAAKARSCYVGGHNQTPDGGVCTSHRPGLVSLDGVSSKIEISAKIIFMQVILPSQFRRACNIFTHSVHGYHAILGLLLSLDMRDVVRVIHHGG